MASMAMCPSCGNDQLNLEDYFSMMVLSEDQALFSLKCPQCGKFVSLVDEIPAVLYPDIQRVAHEVNAGMGTGN